MRGHVFPPHTKIRRDADGALKLCLDGQKTRLSPPRRARPLSEPDKYILLYSENEEELGVLRDLSELDEESRQVLGDALKKAYVIERIVRVLDVEKEALTGQTRWRVELAREDTEPAPQDVILTALDQMEPAPPRDEGRIAAANEGLSNGAPTNGAPANSSPATGTSAANGSPANGSTANDSDASSETTRDDSKILSRIRMRLNRDRVEGEPDVATEEREFLINGQEDVQTARYPHIYIVDTDRNRYEILNCEALDLESRRAAERFF
jgi:hypothetical protein